MSHGSSTAPGTLTRPSTGTTPARRLAGRLAGLGLASVLAVAGCAAPVQQGGTAAGGAAAGDASTLLWAADNGSPTFTRNFNPFSTSKRNATDVLYTPLFVPNALSGESEPFLGESYEQPDASTIVATLREGALWSDGEEVTADDVVFTYTLLQEHPELDTTGVWQYLDTVEADGSTLTFRLKAPDVPAARTVLAVPVVPQHLWQDVADPVTFTNEEPVGSGPYVLGEFTPNQYTLEANPQYWDADALAAETLVLPASNTQLDVVSKGYDWAYAYVSDVEGTWVEAQEGNSYWFPPGGTISLVPNLTQAPFDDVDVRRGLSLALDREQIADVAEEGYVDPAGVSGLLLPNQEEWLDPSLPDGGAVSQDTEAALAAFGEAGFTQEGDRLVGPDGQPLTISLMVPNGYTDWLRGAQEVQKQLDAVGIEVTLEQPQAAAYEQSLGTGQFQMAFGSFGGTGSVFDDFNNLLSSSFYQPVGTSTAANFQRFQDPAVDDVLARLRVATDEGEQRRLGYELQQTMAEQLPVVPLFYGGLWGLFSEAKFTGWPSAEDPYASPATWGQNPLLVLTAIERADG